MYIKNSSNPYQETRLKRAETEFYSSLFAQLMAKFKSVPVQDLVRSFINFLFLLYGKERELLKWLLPCGKFVGSKFEDHQYVFEWPYANIFLTVFARRWQHKRSVTRGEDLFSFAKCTMGYRTDLDCFIGLAAFCGVDFSKTKVLQSSSRDGFSFIENPGAYPTDFTEDIVSMLFGDAVIVKKYSFRNKQGGGSFDLNPVMSG